MAGQRQYTYIMGDNKIYSCGYNAFGQLGVGDNNDRSSFAEIKGNHDFVQIACGTSTVFGIKKDGTLWACGSNQFGQLGDASITGRFNTFTKLSIGGVKKVSFGGHSTFVLKNDGTVWATGHNSNGQLGLGDKTSRKEFVKVSIEDVKKIVSDVFHAFVIKNDGTVWATGYNKYGQLGLGDSVERTVFSKVSITDVKDIAIGGGDHTFILKNDGTVWATGQNINGELGLGNSGTGSERKTFTKVNITDVKQIACGGNHTMALKNDGTVWATGQNTKGQLGLGDKINRKEFTKVDIDDVKQLSCGSAHTIILKNDGTIWSCGENGNGELGLGDKLERITFTKVENLGNISCIVEEQSELGLIKTLIYHSDKYFKLNEDRLLEEVFIKTERDFITYGMNMNIDLTIPDINGNIPIDLLPEEFEIRTYKNKSSSIKLTILEPPSKIIDKLSDTFKVLTYSSSEYDKHLKVNALPIENQLLIPTGDINIHSVDGVDKIYLQTKGENGFVKMIVSGDSGVSWKAFRDGVWKDVVLDKTGIETNGMTSDKLGSITRESWNELLINGTVRFAYVISKDSIDSTYEVDKLEMLVDMKGTWNDTLKTTDYDVEYMNSYLLRVTLKTSGDYKINYADEKSSY